MGTNGVGILTLDTKTGSWSRHDIKKKPIAGHHMGVYFAYVNYVFVGFGWHKDIPESKPGIHVFSVKKSKWIQIDAVPKGDVLSLGYEDSPKASKPVDYRYLGEEDFVPLVGSHIEATDNGDYLMTRTFTNGTRNEQLIRKVLLEQAFEMN